MTTEDAFGLGAFAAILVGIVLLIGACLWANLAWAPHAAEIVLGQQQVQLACVQRGGIWNTDSCSWSATPEAPK